MTKNIHITTTSKRNIRKLVHKQKWLYNDSSDNDMHQTVPSLQILSQVKCTTLEELVSIFKHILDHEQETEEDKQ